MILWFDYNIMNVANVVMFYLAIISDATNEFLPGDNKDLLNWISPVPKGIAELSRWSEWLNSVVCDSSMAPLPHECTYWGQLEEQ